MGANTADFHADDPQVNLGELTFSHDESPAGWVKGVSVVRATHPIHGQVGSMVLDEPWHGDNSARRDGMQFPKGARPIRWIQTKYHLQGIGNAMFQWAKQQGLNPVHSGRYTPEGKEFAARVK